MSTQELKVAVCFGSAGLSDIKSQWQVLVDGMAALNFIQTPQWAEAYLQHLAPSADDLVWLTAHRGDRLVAVLPLERRDGGLQTLSHEHMTLADVAAQPGDPDLVQALWHWLQHDSPMGWLCLRIPLLAEDALLASWLKISPPPLAMSAQVEGCAWLDCTRSYEQLLKSASSNHRSSLSRGAKRAAEMGALRYETHADPVSMAAAMEHFMAVEASGWKGEQGGAVACKPELIAFYRQLTQQMGARGQCEIDLLWLGDRPIATVFWFRAGGQIYLQKIAYLEELGNLGPGKLIMAEALKRACADPTLQRVSFITRCPWADGWRTTITPVWTHKLYRETWRGRTAYSVAYHGKQLKAAAKPLVDKLRGRTGTAAAE